MAICTLVVPTYNASSFIEQTVNRLDQFVNDHPDWRVLFVCDGCKDDTPEKLTRLLETRSPRLEAHIYAVNRGKGYAVRTGLSAARTPYRIFTDVDLAYPPEEALKLLKMLQDGADLVVANRASPDSRFLISPADFPAIYKRHRMSRTFNWYLRQMLPIRILDTQAGLKGITAEAWSRIAPHMTTDGFFVDVEMLARAGREGMKIVETPVFFNYVDPSTVQLVSHGWSMILDTFRLRRTLKREDAMATQHRTSAPPVNS